MVKIPINVTSEGVFVMKLRLMMERNCFETMDRDLKQPSGLSSPFRILVKMRSHNSSGKYEYLFVAVAVLLFGTLDLDVAAAIVSLLRKQFNIVLRLSVSLCKEG